MNRSMKKIENLFFPTKFSKNINLYKIEMEVGETALCHNTYIFIKLEPSNSDYYIEYGTIDQ